MSVEKNERVSIAIAFVLPLYDEPATTVIRSLLSSSTEKLKSSRGLLVSLTLKNVPPSWDQEKERELWRELLLSVPETMPKYADKLARSSITGSRNPVIGGVRERSGGLRNALNTLNQLPRTPIRDESLLQAVFNYLALHDDGSLTGDMYAFVDLGHAHALSIILSAAQKTSSEEVRSALGGYLSNAKAGNENLLHAWYLEEKNPELRGSIALSLLSLDSSSATPWFDWLIKTEPTGHIKSDLIQKLATFNEPAALQRLMELSESGPQDQRKTALFSLSNAHRTYAVAQKEALFLRSVQDPSPEIRKTALGCLYRITGLKHRALFQRLSTSAESNMVRNTARQLLQTSSGPPKD